MYEVEVELDDGDWLLQAFFTDRSEALACTMQMTSGSNPRRCRIVSLKWNPVTGTMDRNTLLEASGAHQVPRTTGPAPARRQTAGASPTAQRATGRRPGRQPPGRSKNGGLMRWLSRVAIGMAILLAGIAVVYAAKLLL